MFKWEENLREVEPYVPGAQPRQKDVIKLNTNENPYPPSPKVIEAIREADLDTALRKYPDPTSHDLTEALKDYYGLEDESVFVGTGSDDVLSIAFLTCFNSDKPIIFPDVTYSFYPVWARVYGIPYREIPVDKGMRVRVEDYGVGGGTKEPNGGVVIANPNAPTGIALSRQEIREIVEANPDVIVIVDEAYVDYSGESALPLLVDHENMLIVRTFSKSRAMAGARIGFAIGAPRIINAMNDVAQSINSYTKPTLSLKAAVASIDDEEYFRARIDDVLRTRARTVLELKKRGFSVLPSSTNFVFASPSMMDAKMMFEELGDRKIYVRYFTSEKTKDYLRITIGTDKEMDALFAAIDEIMDAF